MLKAQVHRFHDQAAIFIGTGSTAYFDAKEARKIARHLNKIAKEIETSRFTESKAGTLEIWAEG